MSFTIVQRILFGAASVVIAIFLYFLFSGVPGFYDPYKLDGKGIDPHMYLCDNFRRPPSQCDRRTYWIQAVPGAGIKTIFLIGFGPLILIDRIFSGR